MLSQIRNLLILNYFCCLNVSCSPVEFLYPVAYNPKQNAVYLMYQKSPDSLELWFWNLTTKEAVPGLLSRFTPAGIRILPSGNGFSFVDHGVVKVQSLIKRSPQRVEFTVPLHDITLLEWIDDDTFYLSAKERSRYGIYQVNRHGEVTSLVVIPNVDCMYPQKIGSQLFYIERLHKEDSLQTRIMQIEYRANEYPVEGEVERHSENGNRVNEQQTMPIAHQLIQCDMLAAFLYMTSLDCGYFVSYPHQIKRTDKVINGEYYQIKREEGCHWTCLKLFSFSLPTNLLFVNQDNRLYESILPLLPKHYGNFIYYNDVSIETQNSSIWSYDVVTGTKSEALYSSVIGQDYFVPLIIGNTLYAGGHLHIAFSNDDISKLTITNTHDNEIVPHNSLYMEPNDSGVAIGLATIQLP